MLASPVQKTVAGAAVQSGHLGTSDRPMIPAERIDGRSAVSEIHLRVDDDLLKLLGASPEEIERHALEMIVLELYRRRAISAGRAAELLHMDQLAFVRWTGSLGIPYFDLSSDELREELRVLGGR